MFIDVLLFCHTAELEDAYVPVFQPNSSAQEAGPGVLGTNNSRNLTK